MNPFTTLNFDKLKEIADRWATQFQRQGGQYNRIILHRYEAPLLTEDTSLRWAIVFDITHYEYQKMTPEEARMNIITDPYLFLVMSSNFPKWVDDRRQVTQEGASTSKFEQAFLKQSGFSTPPMYVASRVSFPEYFGGMANDFPDVYTVGAPENWRHQWLFIPLFKGLDLPHQVHIEDAVVIYPNDASIEPGEEHQSPETLTEDTTGAVLEGKQQEPVRCFTNENATWRIQFDGIEETIRHGKPIEYILELLRQPSGKEVSCVSIIQAVAGISGGLMSEQERGEIKNQSAIQNLQGEDMKKLKKAVSIGYEMYINDPHEQQDNWTKVVSYARENGLIVSIKTDGKLFMKPTQNKSSVVGVTQAQDTFRKAKERFLKKIKNDMLRDHFKTAIIVSKGCAAYGQEPDGLPSWNIIEK